MIHTFNFAIDNDDMPAMIDCTTTFENSIEHLNSYKMKVQIVESFTNKVLMDYESPILHSRQSIVNIMKDYKQKNNDIPYLIKNSICGFDMWHKYTFGSYYNRIVKVCFANLED